MKESSLDYKPLRLLSTWQMVKYGMGDYLFPYVTGKVLIYFLLNTRRKLSMCDDV
jgi:hypothetical protein